MFQLAGDLIWDADVMVVPNMFLANSEHARINVEHASILAYPQSGGNETPNNTMNMLSKVIYSFLINFVWLHQFTLNL